MSDQPLSMVLENMTRQLDRLASLAGSIDGAVGQVPIPVDIDRTALAALQTVDLLRQSLEGLTHYVGKLADQLNDSVLVNPTLAAEALPLRDLARDLVGDDPDSSPVNTSSHDPCFF